VKIGIRLTIALAVPVAALVALFGLLQERANRVRFQAEMLREGRTIARTVQLALQYALRDSQLQDVQQLADEITGYERVLGLRLLHPDGSPRYESASLRKYPAVPPRTLAEVLRTHRMAEIHLRFDRGPVVAYVVPLFGPSGSVLGVAEVLQLESFIEDEIRASRKEIAAYSAAMIAAAAAILFLIARVGVERPIEELVRSFREVGRGEPSSPLTVHRGDEFGRLAEAYNAMCARLDETRKSLLAEQEERRRMEASLREAERMASIGRFAAGLAHEIGTPLNVISGRAEALLRKGGVGEPGERHLRVITMQIERIARIVRGMLDFARPRELCLVSTAPHEMLSKVLELMEPRFEQAGIRLETRVPAELPRIAADGDQLHEVFLNLATNAADAMPAGGVLGVTAERVERRRPEGGGESLPFLAVTFEDSGCGIRPEHVGRVFDPFFTTKEVGHGTGLGLSVSYAIVREHGGWIEVESEVGRGTRATVFIPLRPERVAPASPAAAPIS